MSTLFDRIAARLAFVHARRTYRRFVDALENIEIAQQRVLGRAVRLVARSEFGRRYGLRSVRTLSDLKRAVPLTSYADLRPLIDRVRDGDVSALFSPGHRIVMFATSSGTTAATKYIPVTSDFVCDYRRGWNVFGLKMLSDHPRAVMRSILQSSSRYDEHYSPSGVPCGAITGLMARMQKRIVRRFYVGSPAIARLPDPRARYYTLMRLGITRDVAFGITANPATLIRMAQTADEESERLIRDVRDGTLSADIVPDARLRAPIETSLRCDPTCARRLRALAERQGGLRPRDYWSLEFLACWTGGSMGHYLPRLADWYGSVPVRDIGLLASEGRVSIPVDDNTPIGVLDVQSTLFEFVPIERWDDPHAETLSPRDLIIGQDYAVVLSNSAGLLRYRLDDVVRVHGRLRDAPLVEFLYRAGRVASVAGEKLTENQVVAAVRSASAHFGLTQLDFVLGPRWSDPPFYRLSTQTDIPDELVEVLDRELGLQNDEYRSRRKSQRLGKIIHRAIPPGTLQSMDTRLMGERGSASEQYKRPCLFTQPGEDDRALGLTPTGTCDRTGATP